MEPCASKPVESTEAHHWKVEARYETIHRRVHEDIAGVEIRMTARMADLEGKLISRMADLESRLGQRMSDLESRSLRWLVTALVLNAGLMLLTGWASKHLF